MYKTKNKILTTMLVIVIIMQMIPVALAEEISSVNGHIQGKVIEFSEDMANIMAANDTVVSYEENQDGSITVYQYENGELIEAHTTVPGSLVVYHEYYEDDVVRESVEYIDDGEENALSRGVMSAGEPDYVNERPLGYMHYNDFINPVISIYCYVEEEGYVDTSFTLNAGTAKTLAEWSAWVITQVVFLPSTVNIAAKLIGKWVTKQILIPVLDGMYSSVITRTIPCTYYNQRIYGECTSHSGGYEGMLEGTYIYYDDDIITEGYTTRMWGEPALGRMMFYEVMGLEYTPTSWTNVGV